ncbi:MAG: hypothetical protein ACTHN0_08125, partial [Aquihabitans sp.]
MSEDQREDEEAAGDVRSEDLDPHRILIRAGERRTWTPTFFGVVPAGSVRRRPSDALHLAIAALVVAACYVVTEGFTPRPDRFFHWLS